MNYDHLVVKSVSIPQHHYGRVILLDLDNISCRLLSTIAAMTQQKNHNTLILFAGLSNNINKFRKIISSLSPNCSYYGVAIPHKYTFKDAADYVLYGMSTRFMLELNTNIVNNSTSWLICSGDANLVNNFQLQLDMAGLDCLQVLSNKIFESTPTKKPTKPIIRDSSHAEDGLLGEFETLFHNSIAHKLSRSTKNSDIFEVASIGNRQMKQKCKQMKLKMVTAIKAIDPKLLVVIDGVYFIDLQYYITLTSSGL